MTVLFRALPLESHLNTAWIVVVVACWLVGKQHEKKWKNVSPSVFFFCCILAKRMLMIDKPFLFFSCSSHTKYFVFITLLHYSRRGLPFSRSLSKQFPHEENELPFQAESRFHKNYFATNRRVAKTVWWLVSIIIKRWYRSWVCLVAPVLVFRKKNFSNHG